MWEEFLPNSIKNTNVKWYLFKHDENTRNIHYLVPLSVKFYQIFIFTYDFDTDLFFEYFMFTVDFWWVISVFYSLYTYPNEGLCSDSSKKDLKLQLLFEFYFFQPSFSKVSTTLKKIKTNVWHYSLIAVIFYITAW